ncbi:MAG: TIGR03435 family protein [Acidobacteriota bacterium]|nr:TIGR03435 family protein [Acidobacteriota bacterium]
MKKLMGLIAAAALLFVGAARAQDVTGDWQGTLHAGKDLRIVFKITKDDGKLKAVGYSIDQGAGAMNAAGVTLDGKDLKFAVPGVGGSFQGTLSADGNTISGTWNQGQPLPLVLVRANKETAWDIPAPPKPIKPMAADATPSFEVATIKPSDPSVQGDWFRVNGRNFTTHNISLSGLIKFAYGVHGKQILNGPDWMEQDKYDIAAVPDAEGQPNDKQWKGMLQKLIAERFKMKFHTDQRELAVFAVTVAKDGPKNMAENTGGGTLPGMFFRGTPGGIMLPANNATMENFAGLLQEVVLDKPVVDQTGLKGRYDFTLKWAPDESQFDGHMHPNDAPDAPPNLFTAVQEQIGLKIDSTKAKVDVMVVDHVEKPTAN